MHLMLVWNLLQQLFHRRSWLLRDEVFLLVHQLLLLLEKLEPELQQRAYASLGLLRFRMLVRRRLLLPFRFLLLTYFF
jgi:hypothetical protein